MTTTESIKRAEQSLIALQKERASLEEMKRIAKESLTYLQVERVALEQIAESESAMMLSLLDDNQDDEMTDADLDPLRLLGLSEQDAGGEGDVDFSNLFSAAAEFASETDQVDMAGPSAEYVQMSAGLNSSDSGGIPAESLLDLLQYTGSMPVVTEGQPDNGSHGS